MPAVRGEGRSVQTRPAWGAPGQHVKAWALCLSHGVRPENLPSSPSAVVEVAVVPGGGYQWA